MKTKKEQVKQTEHTPTPSDLVMENIAVYDTLKREGFAESVTDRIERAVNSHEALLKAAKDVCDEFYKLRGDMMESINDLNKAITQAEGEK